MVHLTNVFYSQINLAWFKRWKYRNATQIDGAFRWNVDNNINTKAKINDTSFFNEFYLSKYHAQLGAMMMWLNPGAPDLSLGYKMIKSENGFSHNVSLKFHKSF